ncbi:MAG: FkbM family methyltransferase [Deltaproteobacteria bacterium]|nr:FkbM family methyltransferase [Deltaproteobacteria bacterium]
MVRDDGVVTTHDALVVHANRRLRTAHALARFGVHLPMPLLWLTHHVVCKWLAPPLHARQRFTTIFGFDLVVRPTTGPHYYRNGFYEQGTMHVIGACLRPGDTFVDAGAAVGQMSFHAARLVGPRGRVLAFEPAPERFEDLVDGIAVNALTNITPIAAGLAAEPGELGLYLRGSPSMADQTRHEDTLRVPVHRLDDVLDSHGLSRVRFLKIDVEGLEPEVLLGASRLLRSPEPPIVCYEHGIYRHSTPIAEILPAGYRTFQLAGTAHRASRLVPTTKRLRADNVFAVHDAVLRSLPRGLFA